MKIQAINTQNMCITRNNSNPNFGSACRCVAIPVSNQEDTFIGWAGRNIVTASAVSVLWDMGTNIAAKFSDTVDAVPVKKMLHNIPKVAGIFLLVGGVFKAVDNIMNGDKN